MQANKPNAHPNRCINYFDASYNKRCTCFVVETVIITPFNCLTGVVITEAEKSLDRHNAQNPTMVEVQDVASSQQALLEDSGSIYALGHGHDTMTHTDINRACQADHPWHKILVHLLPIVQEYYEYREL